MSEDGKSLEESLKDLQDALEASKKTAPVGAALQVEDLNEAASKMLTESAKYDLTRKSTQLTIVEEGNVYKPVYFAVRIKKGNTEKALQTLTRIINKLSEQGMIHSFLSGFSSIDLAQMPMEVAQSVVFVFPLVPANAEFNIRHRFRDVSIAEGAMPDAIEDIELDREEGEFFSVVRVSPVMSMMQGQANPKDLLQDEIATLLAVLPKGTVVRKVTECAITDLSVPYEVKFFHPFMKDIKKVELNYVRSMSRHEHGIHQFNLLVGVSYYGHDGKLLFKESR